MSVNANANANVNLNANVNTNLNVKPVSLHVEPVNLNVRPVEVHVEPVRISSPKVEINAPKVQVGVGINSGLTMAADETEQSNSNAILTESLRSYSVCAKCLSCGEFGHTKTEPMLSIINMIFGILCTEFWMCWMFAKRKDWNCWNTRHTCCTCGKYIDTYSAC